ncbi:HEAT repeat domain-containing protein [Paenibacillus senegalimassiliensis]|uniref:HEAT repeat domain-containing protein n=1 Tax=Paenibacillus senegalimassiliensis TaxID=1737426 RepID=UPI00073EFC7D|nr:HEAT repeat domain-containing protein [Paenibacillus senegalimassiliensis]
MSIPLLQELQQEVRRLYIAGSDLATDDFRLKKMLPQFQQLGERAPVFKKLGEGIASLIDPASDPQTGSEAKLQHIGALLHAVLATQGSVQPQGKPEETRPDHRLTLTTTLTYRQLAPIQTALTTTGSGRYEIVIEAYKQGHFQDLRLLPLALNALGDPYAELADYAAEHILPAYGEQIVPLLQEQLDLQGGKSEVRRLNVLCQMCGSTMSGVILEAAEQGSDDIRVAAIGYLVQPEHLSSVMAWTKDKKKAVREAAYKALAAGGLPEGLEHLHASFKGKDQEIVAEALYAHPSSELSPRFIAMLKEELTTAVEQGVLPNKKEAVAKRVVALLRAIDGELDNELEQVYIYAIAHLKYLKSLGIHTLSGYASEYFEKLGTLGALDQLTHITRHHSNFLPVAFQLARKHLSPAELFDRYAGIENRKNKYTTSIDTLTYTIENLVYVQSQLEAELHLEGLENLGLYSVRQPLPYAEIEADWDPRWLDWFIDQGHIELVCAFASPGHARAEQYMRDRLAGRHKGKTAPGATILRGLENVGVSLSGRQQLLLDTIGQARIYNSSLVSPYLIKLMLGLPASAVSTLEAALPYYHYTSHKVLEYIIKELSQ